MGGMPGFSYPGVEPMKNLGEDIKAFQEIL